MNVKINDRVLTPNLNKLAKEGIYFSNFYSEESVGNSSDSEFTLLTSLLPSSSGTVLGEVWYMVSITYPLRYQEEVITSYTFCR